MKRLQGRSDVIAVNKIPADSEEIAGLCIMLSRPYWNPINSFGDANVILFWTIFWERAYVSPFSHDTRPSSSDARNDTLNRFISSRISS